jgi:hypothetical protein
MNPMMKVWLATILTVLLLLSANGKLEKTMQVKINQIGLMKQIPENWQAEYESYTVLYWSIGPFGKSFPVNAYPTSNNQRNIYILTM